MIGTQMNADFQDSMNPKIVFDAYQRKPASLKTKGFL